MTRPNVQNGWKTHREIEREREREQKLHTTYAHNKKGIIIVKHIFRECAIVKTARKREPDREKEKYAEYATEGLCSAATYYLLKGVCDETDRFNSHHVVSHAYNYPLSIFDTI